MLDSPTTMLNDPARLAALDVLDLLDTPAEEAFDRVTRIATRLLSVPVALVTFVDTNRQFFKSSIGLPEPWASQRETPLSHSFCQYIVGSGEPMLVTDARLHPHLKDNLAIPDLGVVAYAGVPLRSADGQVLGALCAIEGSPRTWSDDDLATLHDLAEVVMLVMHQRRRAAVVVERWAEADTAQREKDALLDRVSDAFYALDRSWRFVHLNVHCDKLLQRSREELIGRCIWDEFPEATDSPLYLEFHHALDSGIASEFDFYYPPLDTWFEVRVHPADEGLSVYFRDVSERRQHEAALRYLHEVVDASNDAIIGTDDARRITNWNDAATRIYRKTADEVLGQSASILIPGEYDATATEIREAIQVETGIVYASPQVFELSGYTQDEISSRAGFWLDAVHPDDLERVAAVIGNADTTLKPYAVDMRVFRKDGRMIWLHNRGILHRDDAGSPQYWQGFLLDITDRVIAEEEQERTADTLRAVIDASPLAIMATDARGLVLMWNPTAERLFGWTSNEVIGLPVPLIPALSGDEAAQRLASALRGEQTHGYETRRQRKDGTLIDVSISSAPIRDASGAITGSMAMYLDIRERTQANARLQDTERMLRSLVEQSPGVLYRTPPDNLDVVTYISPQLETMTGWSTQDVIDVGDGWFDVGLHPDDIDLVRSAYRTAAASGEPFHIEYRMRTRSGNDIWVADDAHLVRNDAGIALYWHGLVIDINRRKCLENELRHQAFHDALTGLPNRLLLVDRAERAMLQVQRGGPPVAILFLDLDNFKVVNDSLGHGHGDAVLCEVAHRLTTVVRDADTISRIGGDEFAILLTLGNDTSDAVVVAERIRGVLEPPIFHLGRQINLTTSIGIALADRSVEEPDDLLRRADVAMYRAKAQGRNRIAVFDAILHQVALHRLETETDLRMAVANQQFELHYQPKISLSSGDVTGFEALVRWNHPVRGTVSPAEFIPLAEESGLIVPLGRWILKTACQHAVEWGSNRPGGQPLTMSVNLSPLQFQQPDLVSQVEQTLRATGLAPDYLTIEITETAVMEDIDVTVNRLQALKALGVKIAIDDFGTGYSSLAYLKRFPVDVLKIDQSFVSGMGISPVDAAIVSATITLAHALGITVVAEGVETADQRDRLVALSCDRAQGYFFSKPVSALEARALITTCRGLRAA